MPHKKKKSFRFSVEKPSQGAQHISVSLKTNKHNVWRATHKIWLSMSDACIELEICCLPSLPQSYLVDHN